MAQGAGFRPLGRLAAVTAVPVASTAEEVQYWTFGDVSRVEERDARSRLPVMYDLTILSERPIGWERAKTYGHVHLSASRPGVGFAEVYEVLEGRAALLVQNLLPGPATSFVALIEAGPGELVVVPPGLHHISINMGGSPAVLADVVSREPTEDYGALEACRGMAYYIATSGDAVPNPAYDSASQLQRIDAAAWVDITLGPLYDWMTSDSADFAWLCDEHTYWERFPVHNEWVHGS